MKHSAACLVLCLWAPLSLVWACGSSTETGNGSATGAQNGAGASSGSDGVGGDSMLSFGGSSTLGGALSNGGSGGTTIGGTTATELCGDAGCTCSNGNDDDGDGLIDGFDPECTGAFDNDEGSFATGIPGDNRDPKWQDCFFDGNSGAGDDGCRYHTDCLTGDKAATDRDCKLTDACIKFCAPLTPNGCDCFGCCTVQLPGGGSADILTGSDCSLDKAGDADACPPCTKSAQCGNTCGRCELCPGKTVADLPDDCGATGGGGGTTSTGGTTGTGGSGNPGYTCDNGEQVCGSGRPGCALGYYCSLGCCLPSPPQ